MLDWDLQTGNLTSRKDNIKWGIIENFTYDNLNRLRTTQVDGLQAYSFDIDDNGNFFIKNDAGLYRYNSDKPNAVTDLYFNQNVGGTIPAAT